MTFEKFLQNAMYKNSGFKPYADLQSLAGKDQGVGCPSRLIEFSTDRGKTAAVLLAMNSSGGDSHA